MQSDGIVKDETEVEIKEKEVPCLRENRERHRQG